MLYLGEVWLERRVWKVCRGVLKRRVSRVEAKVGGRDEVFFGGRDEVVIVVRREAWVVFRIRLRRRVRMARDCMIVLAGLRSFGLGSSAPS